MGWSNNEVGGMAIFDGGYLIDFRNVVKDINLNGYKDIEIMAG
jgi:hypothetical protein